MAGLKKQKQYDWKDSNLALFGSDTERGVKKDSAKTEPAWKDAGKTVGLQVWRIVNFKVTNWPKEDYGKFYTGDSYIILNTYKVPPSEELLYDVHFWIGSKSSQDEYGTAAYKTVELDTFLDDKPIQHREVQGHESELFRSYFNNKIMTMEGGAETGFRSVKPQEYKPRLFHFNGDRKGVTVMEVPLSRARVVSGDVFILDLGLQLYQWNGSSCNPSERVKAMQFMEELKSERLGKAQFEVLDEDGTSPTHEFYSALKDEDIPDEIYDDDKEIKVLYRVSDASGKLSMEKVKEQSVNARDLISEDVFLLDVGKCCFVWVGKGASPAERMNGFAYAQKHLQTTKHPLANVVVIKEGQQCKEFQAAIAA
jgi:gelsolin